MITALNFSPSTIRRPTSASPVQDVSKRLSNRATMPRNEPGIVSMSSKLLANGLQKSYGARQVLRDVSLEVGSGEVVGLLGPNGAGKTTAFYMIVGLVPSDAGEIEL